MNSASSGARDISGVHKKMNRSNVDANIKMTPVLSRGANSDRANPQRRAPG